MNESRQDTLEEIQPTRELGLGFRDANGSVPVPELFTELSFETGFGSGSELILWFRFQI